MYHKKILILILLILSSNDGFGKFNPLPIKTNQDQKQSQKLILDFDACLNIAIKNNRLRKISQIQIEIANAQYKQALSSYWPQINARSSLMRMDENANFIFPEETSIYRISGMPIPGLPPGAVIEQTVNVPEKNVKLMEPTSFFSSLGFIFPIYTGGLRKAITRQAKSGVEIAKHDFKKTDIQLYFDVQKIYYSGVLAKMLHNIGDEALIRLEVLLDLTENMYKKGSGRVKKTDYLQNKVIVESVRSMVIMLKNNEELTKSALVNMIGLDWDTEIELSEQNIPFTFYHSNLQNMVTDSYKFNPDWNKLLSALNALEAKIKEAKSNYFPKIALTGNIIHIENQYNAGMMSPQNKDTWAIGIGMEIPIFNGFRTKNQVQEAKLRLSKLQNQQILMKEGLALQIKYLFLQLDKAQKQETAAKAAMTAAQENRDLLERAYKEDLAETEEVVQAQLFESFMMAQYQKVLYDHLVAKANLEVIIGNEVGKRFGEGQ